MAQLQHTGAQLDEAIRRVLAGYADVSAVNATASDVRSGKKIVASDKQTITGSMPDAVITPSVAINGNVLGDAVNGYPIMAAPDAIISSPGYASGVARGATVIKYVQTEEKTVTPGQSEIIVTPASGKLISKVTVAAAGSSDEETIYGEILAQTWGDIPVYAITASITGGSTASGSATSIEAGGQATVTITNNTGHNLPSSVSVSGATYSYNSTTGEIALSSPTGNVSISATCPVITYSITKSITNGSASGDSTISYGGTAAVTISANNGYDRPATIDVSGATSNYDSSTGIVSLSDPTGNVAISAVCPESPITYTLSGTFTHVTITDVDVNGTSVGTTVPSTVSPNDSVTITFTAPTGYTLPSSATVNTQSVPANTAVTTYGNCAADYGVDQGIGTLSLSAFTGNSTCGAAGVINTYSVTSSLWHCTITKVILNSVTVSSLPSTVNYGDSLGIEFTADTGYTMDNGVYSGTMGNTDLANYFWYDSVTDTVNLNTGSINGNISFNVASDPIDYTLTNSFTNLTITSGTIPSTVHYSDDITITFTAASGYTLPSSVTINGYTVNDGSATATYGNCAADYSISNDVGTISMGMFTGNCTVSASGQQSVSYVIPAGTYYGIVIPFFASSNYSISLPFTSNSVSYTVIGKNNYAIIFGGTTSTTVYSNGWDSTYRTIVVANNTAVTEDEYNHFFELFDAYEVQSVRNTRWSISATSSFAPQNVSGQGYPFASGGAYIGASSSNYDLYEIEQISRCNTVTPNYPVIGINLNTGSSTYPFYTTEDGLTTWPNFAGHILYLSFYDFVQGGASVLDETDLYLALKRYCTYVGASAYTITNTITNGTASGSTIIKLPSGTATVTISANSGYDLPSSVSVSGASYTYDDTTGVVTLSSPTGNVTITATCTEIVSDHITLDQFSYSNGTNVRSVLQLSGWDLTATVTNGTANVISPPLGDGTAKLQIVPGTGYAQPSSLDSVTAGVTYSYDSNTGFWSFGNISSDVSVTATCPVRMYTIPAGVYQANSTSTLSDASGTTTINMAFTADGNTYSSLTYEDIDGSTFYINYGSTHVASGTYNGSLTFSDTDNETITLTNDVSVVLAQYNAFYSCYAAYVEPYIIPAGIYYGKETPSVGEFSALAGMYIAYTSNGQNFTSFGVHFGQENTYMRYIGSSTVDAWSYLSGWTSAYRAIEITSDVTVQEYEYNAFFAAFDYGFSVNGVYYGYTTLDMTWSSFIYSSNNTNAAFSIYGSGGQNVMCIDDPEYNIDYAIVEPPTPSNMVYWNGYPLLDANFNPVSASDTIIHSHDYWVNSGGSNN